MADDRQKTSNGLNAALAPDRELPRPPSDEEVERIARKLGAPFMARPDPPPLEGE